MADQDKNHKSAEGGLEPHARLPRYVLSAIQAVRKAVEGVVKRVMPARSPREVERITSAFFGCLRSDKFEDALKIHDYYQDIDFSSFPNYARLVGDSFIKCISKDVFSGMSGGFLTWYDGFDLAIQIRDKLGQGIDFSSIPGYSEAVKAGFYNCLRGKNIFRADSIRSEFGQDIDLVIGAKTVIAGFVDRLDDNDIDGALKIRDGFGKGINFSKRIKTVFLGDLLGNRIDAALKIRKEFGTGGHNGEGEKGIDLTNETRTAFIEKIRNVDDIDGALKIRDGFGRDVDFADMANTEFLRSLRLYDVDKAIRIREGFGRIDQDGSVRSGIDFPSIPGYSTVVKAGFLKRLEEGDVDGALKIRDELGKGIDLASLPGYSKALVAYAKGKFPDLQSLVLGEETDIQKFREYKGWFWFPDDKVPGDEALLDFEALTCLAGDLVREEVKRKIRGLGYDTEAPGFSVRQMAKGHALEAGRFRAEIESRIRARFHAFASPDLFDALKRQSGDEMKWVA